MHLPKIPYSQIITNYDARVKAYAAKQVLDRAAPEIADKEELSDLQKAIAEIHDGARIFLPLLAGASSEAFHELVRQADRFENGVDVYMMVNGIGENLLRQAVQTEKYDCTRCLSVNPCAIWCARVGFTRPLRLSK